MYCYFSPPRLPAARANLYNVHLLFLFSFYGPLVLHQIFIIARPMDGGDDETDPFSGRSRDIAILGNI